jgi:hypothetical protein
VNPENFREKAALRRFALVIVNDVGVNEINNFVTGGFEFLAPSHIAKIQK